LAIDKNWKFLKKTAKSMKTKTSFSFVETLFVTSGSVKKLKDHIKMSKASLSGN
jgi:hypothetical protein